MSQDYLDQLAEFAAHTRLEDLDATTIAAAKSVVMDTIGRHAGRQPPARERQPCPNGCPNG